MVADVLLLVLDALETTKELLLAVFPAFDRALTVAKPAVRRPRHTVLHRASVVFDALELRAVLRDDALLDLEFLDHDDDLLLARRDRRCPRRSPPPPPPPPRPRASR